MPVFATTTPCLGSAGAGASLGAGRSGVASAGTVRRYATIAWISPGVIFEKLSVDRFSHRARAGAATVCVAGRQVLRELLVAPCADAGCLVARDVVGDPAFGVAAGELLRVVQRLQEIARRMAIAAMRQSPRRDRRRDSIPDSCRRRAGIGSSGLKRPDQTAISQRWLNGNVKRVLGRRTRDRRQSSEDTP